ncbi:histone-lysine N-methyltransferase SETMAR-like isoform X1, partial [Arapaima gigas]
MAEKDHEAVTPHHKITEFRSSFGSVHMIITEYLGTRRMAAKFISKLLAEEEKVGCLSTANDLLQHIENERNFMKNIIIGDNTKLNGYDLETKLQWKTPEKNTP